MEIWLLSFLEAEASFEAGEWKKARSSKTLLKAAKNAANEFLKKDARINIRISSLDLDLIKQISVQEGLSYQTLIGSILHKFAHNYEPAVIEPRQR